MKKQKLLEEKINLIANSIIHNKHEKLSKVLTTYYKYCYDNNLKSNIDIFELGPLSYIVESEPLIFEVDENLANNAFKHLQQVIENNKNGVPDGLNEAEAELILNWTIQNARKSLAKAEKDFLNSSLTGYCGYAQSMTLLPLMEAGLEVTINNTSLLPGAIYRHAFGTVKVPIKINNKVIFKQFLLDASYRQFFTTAECNPGRYYLHNYDAGPSAGYYVCETEEGRKFAQELLKKGYIELTEHNAKIYGNGFVCEALNLETLKRKDMIANLPGSIFIDAINNNQEHELNNDKDELERSGDTITPPGLNNNRGL